jgi:hypothetical protein
MNGDIELARLDIPPEALATQPEIQDETVTRKTISTALMFAPFVIEKPTSLRLMADTEEGEIVGPRLLIKVAPEMVQNPFMAPPVEPAQSKSEAKKPSKRKSTPAAKR